MSAKYLWCDMDCVIHVNLLAPPRNYLTLSVGMSCPFSMLIRKNTFARGMCLCNSFDKRIRSEPMLDTNILVLFSRATQMAMCSLEDQI